LIWTTGSIYDAAGGAAVAAAAAAAGPATGVPAVAGAFRRVFRVLGGVLVVFWRFVEGFLVILMCGMLREPLIWPIRKHPDP